MKNLWQKWCLIVEKHNEPLLKSWSTSDEAWNPSEIFMPIVFGIILSGIFGFMMLIAGTFNLAFCIEVFLSTVAVFGLFMFINWKVYS